MGRRKITISQIVDPKLRHITFNKRKNGLIKKAAELALLCNVNMLLCFEDDQGNLIQFSKNRLANIPSFFNECRYNNVLEFVARDYPNFFKVNHYKKYRTQTQNEDFDQDDMDFGEEDDLEAPSMDPTMSSEKSSTKRAHPHANSQSNDEHQDSSRMVYQSDEETDNDPTEGLTPLEKVQFAPRKQVHVDVMKSNINIPQEKPKEIVAERQVEEPIYQEREVPLNKRESFQSYNGLSRSKKPDIAAQFANFEHSFKRASQSANTQNSSFRYYGNQGQGGDEMNMREPTPIQNSFNNVNYKPAYQFYPNQGYINVPSNYPVGPKLNRVPVYNEMPNEEQYMMIKVPIGIQGPAYIAKNVHRPEIDENMYETANMIKILNGTTNNNNGYTTQKLYNYHPMDMGKAEEVESATHMKARPDYQGYQGSYDQEYMDNSNYMRNDYRFDPTMQSNLPSNLPSAYFSSKKFNFEGNM